MFRPKEKSLGLNDLFDVTNSAFYILAFFSIVIDYRQETPFPTYILAFLMGPIQGSFYVGEDEFITWRWNAMYNRRDYWHPLLNFAMLLTWCVVLPAHMSIEKSDSTNVFPMGDVIEEWIDHVGLSGSVCLLCWHLFLFTFQVPSTLIQGNQGIRCAAIIGFSMLNAINRFILYRSDTVATMMMMGLAVMSKCAMPQLGIDDRIPNLTTLICLKAMLIYYTKVEDDYPRHIVWIFFFTFTLWHFTMHFNRQAHLQIYQDQLLKSKKESEVTPVMGDAEYISSVAALFGTIQCNLSSFILPRKEFRSDEIKHMTESIPMECVKNFMMEFFHQTQMLNTLHYTYDMTDNKYPSNEVDGVKIAPFIHYKCNSLFKLINRRLGGKYPFYSKLVMLRRPTECDGASSPRSDGSLLSLINTRSEILESSQDIQVEFISPVVNLMLYNLFNCLTEKSLPGAIKVSQICRSDGTLNIIVRHTTCIKQQKMMSSSAEYYHYDRNKRLSSILPEDHFKYVQNSQDYLKVIEYLRTNWLAKWNAEMGIDGLLNTSILQKPLLAHSKIVANGYLKIDRYRIEVPPKDWRKVFRVYDHDEISYDFDDIKNKWCLVIDSDPNFQRMYKMQREVLGAMGIPYAVYDADRDYIGVGRESPNKEVTMRPANRTLNVSFRVMILKEGFLDPACQQVSRSLVSLCNAADGLFILIKEKDMFAVSKCRFHNPIHDFFGRLHTTEDEIFHKYFDLLFARKPLQVNNTDFQKISDSIKNNPGYHRNEMKEKFFSLRRIENFRNQRNILIARLESALSEATTLEASIHRCKLKWILLIENGFHEILKNDCSVVQEDEGKDEGSNEGYNNQENDYHTAAISIESKIDPHLQRTKDFLQAFLPLLKRLRNHLKDSDYMNMDALLTTQRLRSLMKKGGDVEFLEAILSLQDVLRIVIDEFAVVVNDTARKKLSSIQTNVDDIDEVVKASSRSQVVNSVIADMVDMVEVVVWQCVGRRR